MREFSNSRQRIPRKWARKRRYPYNYDWDYNEEYQVNIDPYTFIHEKLEDEDFKKIWDEQISALTNNTNCFLCGEQEKVHQETFLCNICYHKKSVKTE